MSKDILKGNAARIEKPTDDYDPMWVVWNEQNPFALKSVGSDVADEEGDEGEADDDAGDDQADDQPQGEEDSGDKDAEKSGDEGEKDKVSEREAKLLKESLDRKRKLKESKDEIANLKKELEKFEDVDLDEVKKLLSDQKVAKEKALEAKGEWDRLKKMMADEHTGEVKSLMEQIESLKSDLGDKSTVIEDLTVGRAFGDSNFIQEKLLLSSSHARKLYGSHFEVEEGEVVAYDKPRSSSARTKLVDSSGDALPFEEAFKKIIDADPGKDSLLKSDIKKGAASKAPEGKAPKAKEDLHGASRILAALNK